MRTIPMVFQSASRLSDDTSHQKVWHDMGRSDLPGMRGIVPVSRREGRKEGPPVRAAKNMAKKYQRQASTGKEYVDAARERS